MQKKLEQRLKELKTEFASGQKMLADLESKQLNLRETLLRISGAIQVLEEALGMENGDNGKAIQQQDLTTEEKVDLEKQVVNQT